ERCESQGAVVLVVVVESDRAARQLPVERRVAALPRDRRRAEQDPVRLKPEAVARAGGIEPKLLRRAEAGQRAAELDARLGSHREVLGSLDQVPVLDLLVVVVHEFVAEKGRDESLILRKWRGRGEKVRFDLVGILEVAQAHRIAMRPVIYQARGPDRKS